MNLCACGRCQHSMKIPSPMMVCTDCLLGNCTPLRPCPYRKPKKRPAVEAMDDLKRINFDMTDDPSVKLTHFSGFNAPFEWPKDWTT